jgi:hypothetical protein
VLDFTPVCELVKRVFAPEGQLESGQGPSVPGSKKGVASRRDVRKRRAAPHETQLALRRPSFPPSRRDESPFTPHPALKDRATFRPFLRGKNSSSILRMGVFCWVGLSDCVVAEPRHLALRDGCERGAWKGRGGGCERQASPVWAATRGPFRRLRATPHKPRHRRPGVDPRRRARARGAISSTAGG